MGFLQARDSRFRWQAQILTDIPERQTLEKLASTEFRRVRRSPGLPCQYLTGRRLDVLVLGGKVSKRLVFPQAQGWQAQPFRFQLDRLVLELAAEDVPELRMTGCGPAPDRRILRQGLSRMAVHWLPGLVSS